MLDSPKDLPTGSLTDIQKQEEKAKRLSKVQLFMTKKAEQDASAKSALKQAEHARLANPHYIAGLDNAMQGGIGRSLLDFVAMRRAVPLKPGERRYFVDGSTIGEPAGTFVSCIVDEATGHRWLETPAMRSPEGRRLMPKLILAADRGSIGFPGISYMLSELGVRGFAFWDPWHMISGYIENAIKAVGEWVVVLEYLVVLNLPIGPWEGQASYQRIHHLARLMQKDLDCESDLYRLLYDRMCRDVGAHRDANFGSPDHYEQIWRQTWEKRIFYRQNAKVKLCRWMSFWDALDDLSPHMNARLMVQIFLGVQEKMWDSYEDSPLMCDFANLAAEQENEGEAGEGSLGGGLAARGAPGGGGGVGEAVGERVDRPRGVRQQEKAIVQENRRRCKNTMHFATVIQSSPSRRQRVEIMSLLVRPIRLSFGKDQERTTTIRGCKEFHIDQSASGADPVVKDIFAHLLSKELCEAASFLMPSEVTGSERAAAIQQETEMAQRALKIATCLVGRRLATSMHSTAAVPGKLAGLLSEDCNVVASTLTYFTWLRCGALCRSSRRMHVKTGSTRPSWTYCIGRSGPSAERSS